MGMFAIPGVRLETGLQSNPVSHFSLGERLQLDKHREVKLMMSLTLDSGRQ